MTSPRPSIIDNFSMTAVLRAVSGFACVILPIVFAVMIVRGGIEKSAASKAGRWESSARNLKSDLASDFNASKIGHEVKAASSFYLAGSCIPAWIFAASAFVLTEVAKDVKTIRILAYKGD